MTEHKKDDTRLHLNPLLPLLRSTLVHGGEGATYKQDLLSCSGSHSLRLPALPSSSSSSSSPSPSPPPSSTSFSLPSSPLRKKDESTVEGRRRQYTLLSSASTTSAPSVLFASSTATSSPPTPGSGQAVRAPALSLRLLGGLSPLPSPRVRRASDDRNDTTKNESDSEGRSQRAKAKEVRIVEGISEPGASASASGAEETAAAGNDQDGEERKVRVRRGSFSRTQQALRQSFRHKLRPPKPLGSEGSGETATVSSSMAVAPVFADPIHSFHVSDKQLLHLELDGGVLYVLSQDRIHLYDTESREHMYSIDAVARRIAVFDHMLYYANRTTVSSNERDVIVAWSTKLRKVTHIFKGHQKWITSLFVHDKMLYSAATDHTCRQGLPPQSNFVCWNVVRWTTQGFTTARTQRPGRQGPANMEETVEEALKLWGELFQSSETAEPVKAKSSSGIVMPTELRVYRDDDAVTSVAICTERKLLFTASPTQAVRAWSLLSGERVGEYVGHTDWVYGVIVHGGELYSCSRDQTIRSWNIETFECTQVFETATNNLNTKKFFVAGGVLFVTCDDFALRLYNTRTGKVIRVLEGHTRPIRCMVLFKSQRELFTASGDGTIRRWNFKKGLELAVYKCHTEGVTSITIDEQRRLLYSAGQDGVVCVWDLSEAGDRANKQLSETDGELMQYKRRIDNIIQRNAGALVADDKLIKVTDEVLRLIQQGDDDQGAVVKEENEAPTTSSVVPPSPAGLPPLSPRLAHAAVHDGQAKAAKSSSANAAKGTLLKSGLLKLARGDSWRTKPGSNRTRDEVKHHRDDDGMRKLHTADAIMENAQKTRTKGDGAERVVLVDPLEDKRKKKEKEKEKKSNNEEPGKAATGGMKVKDQLFRLGATFSFDRKRREKKEAQQQQLEVKRSISEGDMPAVPATHKDRIQWLPEDKYSSNQSLIIKPAGQLEARNVRNVDAGSSGGGAGSAEMTATAEKKEHSREFDILGWMEEQIAIQDESEERREERAKSNSDERMNQPQADEQKSLAAEAEQYRDSRQEPGDSAREGPSVPAVEEGIENIALVVMQPFADISYIEFGTVLFKVISLCMRLCDADRRPTTKREQEPEASAVDEDDDEAKRVRNDLRLSVKEFTRNGMTLLQHIKRKALAKEALAVGLVGLEEDADDVDSREDEGSDRKAFLTAARIMLAAVKQLAEWLHGLGDSKPGRASQRTKSESGSDDAPPAADVDEQQTQTLFANLERQCGPETQHLLAEVRKPLGESTPASSAAARDILALGLPVFTELVGTLKRAADGDAVQSAQWAALADRHLLVLIQAARAVACADNGGSADLEAVQQRRQRLLVLECAVVVKASEAFRCRDDTMTEAAQALLRQKCGQLLAAVVQLLTTIRHECPAPKRNVD